MKHKKAVCLFLISIMLCACQSKEMKKKEELVANDFEAGTFGYDLNFLRNHDSVIVLQNKSGQGQVIVSAKYQAKVFTSTANGLAGQSFGWLNYKAFAAEKDPHMNAYGGENRLWLGPEGSKFSLFFKPGSKMEFANWVTPPAIDTESWHIVASDSGKVSLQKATSLLNYAGTQFKIQLDRDIQILENTEIEKSLNIELNNQVQAVGFSTQNRITNTGEEAWTSETGAPCLWLLDMFNPSPHTVIIIPYRTTATGKVATTDYFGEIAPDRITYQNNVLLFKADGKARGKLGIAPEQAKPIAGSYDATNNILTITTFDLTNQATYLNQEWTTAKNPLQGDAVNAYNDGPLADGSQMGPFYEIESVSPAAFLKPSETLRHQHQVFHFTGERAALNAIAEKVLGISLLQIQAAFKQ